MENIAKELDRRSVWLSRERTTLRITQRGMMEATISGSIVTVVTLRIPVSQMYALEVTSAKDDDDPPPSGSTSVPPAKPPVPPSTKLTVPSPVTVQNPPKLKSPARRPQPAAAKVLKIDLTEIDQPLYREVDAMNGLIATTRVQTPAGIANLYDAFQKEPDGLDFTVLQGPAPLKLWENNRHLGRLELNELVDLQPDNPRSYWVLGIWSQVPLTRQVAKFKSGDEDKFLTALHQGKIGLAERTDDESRQGSPADERGHTWYRFVSCAAKSDRDNAAGTMSKHRPAPGEVWLGMEGKYGSITGFDHEFEDSVGLARAYACCRRIPGTVNVCAKKHKL